MSRAYATFTKLVQYSNSRVRTIQSSPTPVFSRLPNPKPLGRVRMSTTPGPSSSPRRSPVPNDGPPPTDMGSPLPTFDVSPIPPNPLGEGRCIRTAAALIIGDEILNGKTLDKNSHFFAQYCFEHGVDLKRIEVVADSEEEIVEASRRLASKFDFVVTSGGIGPTHDDITYQSLAIAFDQPLAHHEETIRRMHAMSKHRQWIGTQNPEQRAAAHRMALFPERAEIIYVGTDIWVPVVRLAGRLCVFPGIPALFQKMLLGLTPFLPLPPKHERPLRIQIFTERAESMIAPYLTSLQERMRPHGIQVGSYPVLYKGVYVSLIGRDLHTSTEGENGRKRIWLAQVAREVEQEVGGKVVSEDEIAAHKAEKLTSPPKETESSPELDSSQKAKI